MAAACALAATLPLHAQQQQPQASDDRSLSPVVVTASGFEQEIADAPASISVITREDLEKRPFRDLTDALRDIEGVAVTGPSNERDIFIRGLPGAYTLILVDGKRQSTRDARTNGNAGFEQSFIPPLEAIERIEVVRGPMSSLYGSDAMGGVINIITRKVAKAWGGSIGLDYTAQEHGDGGNSHQQQFYIAGPVQTDLLGLQLWGRQYHREEDGVVNGFNGARDRDLTARLASTPNPYHDILLEAGTTDVRRRSAPGYSIASTGTSTYNTNDRDHASISHTGRWGWATSQISLQRETYTLGSGSTGWVRNARAPKIENTVLDAKLTAPLGRHLLVAGAQWNEGDLTDQNPGRRTGLDEHFKIVQKALFVKDEWRITDRWALTGGLRLDDHDVYGQHWSPRLYSVWHASEQVTFKGGVSRGFRAPDIRSIAPGYAYTTGGAGCTYGANGTCGVIIGDPNLKPETSTSYEIAALWDNQRDLSASATVFYTDFKDKVSNALVYNADGSIARWAEDPNYRLWYNYNIDNATIAGLELSARWKPSAALSVKSGYTYTDSQQKGGAYDGYALARTPKHLFNLRADWVALPGLTLWSAYTYHGKEINAGARIGTNGTLVATGVREYAGYGLFDLGASYAVSRNSTVNVALYNLGDKRLDELTYNTVGDGRRVWVGVNVSF
ncbi:TonB-dependent receptor domain-containing protein [Xylophilus sp.]|uniref:TonB-dependent receptor domain-containing protein n=1 Tax=Xylophilus sp. TaxID=2653893 RepID=UPI0013BC1FA5|nr:TonB-dependent receptor [Xylophilus sp.]KAF1044713.1 MAG: Colicin I receptor [Xylophilus sp.]